MRQRMMILFAVVGTGGPVAAQSPGVPPAPMPPAASQVRQAGGCADCGSSLGTSKHGLHGGLSGAFKPHVGTVSPIGCSCPASDRTFIFGSCNQFFNPGRRCDGSPACGWWGGKCPYPVYGPGGIGAPYTNCNGPFSYLNR